MLAYATACKKGGNKKMAYIGNKMSERAAEAYKSGEMPLSKWNKESIISNVLNACDKFEYCELDKYSKEVLEIFLIMSSWHHTGKYFNETNFYSLDYDFLSQTKENIISTLKKRKKELIEEKEKKKSEKLIKCLFSYIEWSGTRKHPKATNRQAYGIIKGNWIYYSCGKKKLSGNYIQVIKEFERAPRGTAEEFKRINVK